MKANFLVIILCSIIFLSGCSKPVETTKANVKLNLSKIINFNSGIGQGGAILFGKSSTGEQFGKFITAGEENLELTNGNWVFYAVMWEKLVDHFDSKAYCGTSTQELKGQAASVNLNLTNANCASNVFAGVDGYVSGGANRFADMWLEECDDVNTSNSITCQRFNQGSALSYRFVFKSYKKAANGTLSLANDAFYSGCKGASSGGVTEFPTNLNFPTSNSGMPFVISVEMFQGTTNCGVTPETKGVYTYTFNEGLGSTTAGNKLARTPVSGTTCLPSFTEDVCIDHMGSFSASCNGVPPMVLAFNDASCGGNAHVAYSAKGIKQMVSMPKSFLCRFNDSMSTGAASFAGGDGSLNRPYKICNEWQMNQIGEFTSALSTVAHYKLMNDLDMNRAGLTGYPAPHCAGLDDYDLHMNLNPLDKIECDGAVNTAGFYGSFNGNNKTISNARINSDSSTLNGFGFVRQLSGLVKDLTFRGLEVRGGNSVGGIAGSTSGTTSRIMNVTIIDADVEGENKVGAVVGEAFLNAKISNVHVKSGNVDAEDTVGGLIGENAGVIEKSSFRGSVTNQTYATSNYAGGIAAINSGTIINTFSEGVLSASSSYIGGIAGTSNSSSTVKIVYSTMALVSTKEASSVVVGGIVGKLNSGATLEDCFSDVGILRYGNSSIQKNNIVGQDLGGSVTTSSCFSDSAKIITPFVGESYNNLRAGTKPGSVTFNNGNGNWVYTAGSTPRLAWETDRPCLLTANQAPLVAQSGSRGTTPLNPMIICNVSQFNTLNGAASGKYYKLADDLNLSDYTMKTINTFNGNLDGNDRVLYGLDISVNNASAENTIGIIGTNNGTISRLNLSGNSYTNTDTLDSSGGLLAGKNTRTISQVNAFGNIFNIFDYGGGLVGKNEGVNAKIVSSNSELNKVTGITNIGGVAGFNDNIISKVTADINVGLSSPGYAWGNFGGIVGNNAGTISESSVRGQMNFSDTNNTNSFDNIGGLVGLNDGNIIDSYVRTDFQLTTQKFDGVGGLVGKNTSGASIDRSFSVGKVIPFVTFAIADAARDTNATTDERKIGPLVGISTGSITNSFYGANTLIWNDGFTYNVTCNAPGSLTVDLTPPASGAFSKDGDSEVGAVSFTASGYNLTYDSTQFTCTPGIIRIGKDMSNYAEHGVSKNRTEFSDINTFSAYGIAEGSEPVVLNYYVALMSGLPVPTGSPVWVLDANDSKYPKLLQVEH